MQMNRAIVVVDYFFRFVLWYNSTYLFLSLIRYVWILILGFFMSSGMIILGRYFGMILRYFGMKIYYFLFQLATWEKKLFWTDKKFIFNCSNWVKFGENKIVGWYFDPMSSLIYWNWKQIKQKKKKMRMRMLNSNCFQPIVTGSRGWSEEEKNE